MSRDTSETVRAVLVAHLEEKLVVLAHGWVKARLALARAHIPEAVELEGGERDVADDKRGEHPRENGHGRFACCCGCVR